MPNPKTPRSAPPRLTDEQVDEDIERLTYFHDGFLQYCLQDRLKSVEKIFQVILDEPCLKLAHMETEKTVPGAISRGVRLDAFARDAAGRLYDLEIQRDPRGASLDRAFMNAAALVSAATKPGATPAQAPHVDVVFATVTDVLAGGLPFYRWRFREDTTGAAYDGVIFAFISRRNQDPNSDRGKLMADLAETDPDKMHFKELAEPARYFKREGGRPMLRDFMREFHGKEMDDYAAAVAATARLEGANERAEAIALNMLAKGFSIDDAAQCAELPLAEVMRLQGEKGRDLGA